MTLDLHLRRNLLSTFVLTFAAFTAAPLFAQTNYYYENPSGTSAWDTVSPFWATPTQTSPLTTWANGTTNIANITTDGATSVTLTLSSDITAQSLFLFPTTLTSPNSSNTATYTIAGSSNLILNSGQITQDYATGNQAGIIDTTIDDNVVAGTLLSPTNLIVTATGTVGSTKPAAFGDTTLDLAGANSFADLHIGGGISANGAVGFNTVFIDNSAGFASTTNLSFDGPNSAFGVNGSSASPITITTNNIVINNPGSYSVGTFVVGIGATTGNTLDVNGAITGKGDLQFSAGFSGDSGLGTGTVILNSQSSYVGQTRFNAGISITVSGTTQATVQLGTNNALPTGTDLIMSFTVGNGGIFDLHGFNQTVGSISTTVAGSPSFITNNGNQLSTLTVSGTDSPAAPFSDAINDGGSPIALVRAGSGSTVLANANSTYSGGTTILGGTLSVGADGDLGSVGFSSPMNNLVINGGTLAITGSGFTLGSNRNLALGPATAGTGTGTISVAPGGNLIYNGIIVDNGAGNGGTGGLTLTGGGTLTLGNSNTYSGPTLVSQGNLALSSGSSLSASSTLTVASGGTLSGTGTANGSVIVSGNIAPGTPTTIGTLSTGNLTLAAGGSYTWKLGDTTSSPGNGWDVVDVAGGLTLSSTSANPFVIDAVAVPSGSNFDNTVANSWTIVSATSPVPAFNSNVFSVSSLLGVPGSTFTVTGSGDNLVLNYSPGATQFYVWMKPNGGSGAWNTSSPNWTSGANPPVAWPNTTTSGAEFSAGSGTVTLSGPITSAGLLFQVGGYTIAGSSTLTTNSVQVLNAGTTDSITAPISAVSFTKTGSGTLILSNTSNALTGTTTLGGGTLQGNALSLGNTTPVSIGSTSTLVFDQSTPGTFSGNISGSGTLIKQNTGALTLSGSNSTFAGPVQVIGGTLSISADSELGSGGPTNTFMINGATLQTTAALTSARLINVGTSGSSSPTATIDVDGQFDALNGGTATQPQVILNNTGTLTVINSGATTGTPTPGLNIWGISPNNNKFTGTTGQVVGFTPGLGSPGNVIVNGTNLTIGNVNDVGPGVALGNSGELVQFAFGPSGSTGTNLTLENGASLTVATSISLTSGSSLASVASLSVLNGGTITDYRANTAASSTSINVTSTATTINSPLTLSGTLTLLPGGETSTTSPRLTVGNMTLLANSTIQTAANVTTLAGAGVAMNFAEAGTLSDNGYATNFFGQLTTATAATGPTGVEINGTGFNGSTYAETGLWTIGNAAGTQGISVSPGGTNNGDITTGNIVINPFGQLSVFKAQSTGFPGQTITVNGVGCTSTSGALVGDGLAASTTTLLSTIALGTLTASDAIDAAVSATTIFQLSGNLTGGGLLLKQGSGQLAILGVNNSATGGTRTGNGILQVGNSGSNLEATLPIGDLSVSETGTATGSAATVNFDNSAQSIGNLISTFAAGGTGTITDTINLNGTNVAGGGTVLTINESTANTFGNNGTLATQTSAINGVGSIVLSSASTSTLTFTGTNTYSGGTTVNGGTLNLDFSTPFSATSNILLSTGPIAMGGGTLSVNGKATGGSSQTVGSLSVNSGASAIVNTSNGSASNLTITSGTIGRSVGGTLDFTLPSSGSISFSSSPALTGGILGGWATVGGGASFATITSGAVSAYSGATSISSSTVLASGTNYDVAASLSANGAANSLRFTNTSTAVAISLSGTVPISTGGILVPAAVTSADSITGGTLEGASGADLVVIQNSASTMSIGSTIADNGSATGLTKSGTGTLALNAANTYSGTTTINSGTLRVDSGGTSGTLGSGAVVDNAALSFDRSDTGLVVANAISGTGSVNQIGSGTTTLTAANTVSGQTTISNGVLQLGNANALQNSTISIGVTNGLAFSPNIGTFTIGGLSGTANEQLEDPAIITNPVTLLVGNNNSSTSYSGSLNGSGGITKIGAGTLTLTGANLYTGTTAANGGTLKLDFSAAGAPAANILPSGSALALGGGSLLVNSAASGGGSSQTVASLSVNPGASTIVNTSNSSVPAALVVTASSITRNTGGTVDFTPPSGAQSASNGIVTTASNTSGILGGWATVGGTDWATVSSGNVVAYSAYTNDTWTPGANTTVTQNDAPAPGSTNSLRFASTTVGNLVTLSGPNVITSGGILISSAVTAATTLTGGTIEGSASGDLIINQNSVSNFTLSSQIADNGGATGLTKSGPGTLVLGTDSSTNNTFTGNVYINQGMVLLNAGLTPGFTPSGNVFSGGNLINFGANAAGTTPVLNLNALNASVGGLISASSNATVEGMSAGFGGTPTLTITGSGIYNYAGSLIDGGAVGVATSSLALTMNGIGTQILSGTDVYSAATIINAGTLQIGNGGSTGSLGTGSVTDNSILTFDLSSSPIIVTAIQGTGQLHQIGTGTTTLTSSNNTYSNGTFVANGTLATTGVGVIGAGPLFMSAVSGANATANLANGQSVSSITNTTAVGGTTRVIVASGQTLTSTGALTNTGTLNINVAGQSDGSVVVQSAPTLNANSGIVVNAGVLEFILPSSNPATVQAGASVTVAPAATLQLAGSSSALSNGSSGIGANVNNHGSPAAGGGFIVTGTSETVGVVAGTPSTDVNGATVFDGTTTVGNGSPSTLVAAQILQNSLIIGAGSTVAIIPSTGSGPGVVVSSAVASESNSDSGVSSASASASGPSGDAFAAIESALTSNSTQGATMTALRSVVAADPGAKLSPIDARALYIDYQVAIGNTSSIASVDLPPTLVGDLAGDGLSSSEVDLLTDGAAVQSSSSSGIGSLAGGLGVGASSTAVPEPTSLMLIALGAMCLGIKTYTRRRSA